MKFYQQLREVYATVRNPIHDGRKRYGPEAMFEFPVGYRFFVWEDTHTGEGRRIDTLRSSAGDDHLGFVHRGNPKNLGHCLVSNSTPVDPRSVQEAIAADTGCHNERFQAQVLQRLVDIGEVSLQRVAELAVQIYGEE